MLVHIDHGVTDRFAAENAVSGCKTGLRIRCGFLRQLRALRVRAAF